jgi:hypothetical protein
MLAHKFEVGVVVAFRPIQRWLPSEDYTVVRHLPAGEDRRAQYRLKSIVSGQERVAREDQLRLRNAA